MCCFAEFVTIFHFPPKGEIYRHNERGIYGIITHSNSEYLSPRTSQINYHICTLPVDDERKIDIHGSMQEARRRLDAELFTNCQPT